MFELTLVVGCTRFGYHPLHVPTDSTPEGIDAAVTDAESRPDASAIDASVPDASATDAAKPDTGNDTLDAATYDAATYDAGDPDDGAMPESMDGSADGSSSGTGSCPVVVTMNTYLGSPRYHGWLALQNAGATTWTTPTIRFDLPSSVYVCNDADILPGAGWTLQSSGGHCTYTKTSPSLSIAPGATLDFEYSSNNPTSPADPAAANLSVSGCP